MAGYFIRDTGVHNTNIRIIVFINLSMRLLGKSKLPKHRTQEHISLGRSYSINKICFHVTQRIDQLILRPINNCTPGKYKIKSSSGSHLGRIISICIIKKTSVLPQQCLAQVWGYFRPIQSDEIWVLKDPVRVFLFFI